MKISNYKNLFFDRDGVINEVIMRGSLVSSPRNINEFHIKEDFINFKKRINDSIKCFVVTNQPDIARELLTADELSLMHQKLNNLFNFLEIKYCPHDDSHECRCRKPKPGMINSIIKKYNLRKSESLMIGDSLKDVTAAKRSNIDCVYLKTNYNKKIDDVFNFHSLLDLL